jgi:hypothetical protein
VKIKYTLDRATHQFKKEAVMQKLYHELGAKITIGGDVIIVDESDERRVEDILKREQVKYTREKA